MDLPEWDPHIPPFFLRCAHYFASSPATKPDKISCLIVLSRSPYLQYYRTKILNGIHIIPPFFLRCAHYFASSLAISSDRISCLIIVCISSHPKFLFAIENIFTQIRVVKCIGEKKIFNYFFHIRNWNTAAFFSYLICSTNEWAPDTSLQWAPDTFFLSSVVHITLRLPLPQNLTDTQWRVPISGSGVLPKRNFDHF